MKAENRPLLDTLRLCAATLRDAHIPFMLGGSLAVWARGGPMPEKDLDLMVTPDDAGAALQALVDGGLAAGDPPEEWLYKAWLDDVMVDVIFRPAGIPVSAEMIDRAERMAVVAVEMPVMSINDVLATKLAVMGERTLDYAPVLAMARAVREQIDWNRLRADAADSPYAKPFFTLVEELDIVGEGVDAAPARGVHVLG
ncbi:MAG: hypothetical protein J2O48_00040 [Solirubrobacterales bacterium]|nr:hypothetical protein [Solirubrobacterales bacterium]